jgi:hypothetical protein
VVEQHRYRPADPLQAGAKLELSGTVTDRDHARPEEERACGKPAGEYVPGVGADREAQRSPAGHASGKQRREVRELGVQVRGSGLGDLMVQTCPQVAVPNQGQHDP